jgi:hypothetical protein
MIAMGVIYPQFQGKNPTNAKENFHTHLSVLKETFRVLCEVVDCGKIVPTLLLVQNLDRQMSFINMTMVHNVKAIFCEDNELNPINRLWWKLYIYAILTHKLSQP